MTTEPSFTSRDEDGATVRIGEVFGFGRPALIIVVDNSEESGVVGDGGAANFYLEEAVLLRDFLNGFIAKHQEILK